MKTEKESTTESTQATQEVATKQKGTTEVLFPEQFKKAEAVPEVKEPTKTEPEVKETKTEDEKSPPIDEATKKYLEDLGVVVKTKINGEEGEVTVEELKRGYQTARALTLKGQELARKEKELRVKESELAKPKPSDDTYNTDEDLYAEDVKGKLERELNELKQQLSSYAPLLEEVKYKSDLDGLDARMRAEGLDDFMKYVPAIEQEILDAPLEERRMLMTYEHFESRFKSMKLAELSKGKPKDIEPRPKPKVSVETSSASTETDEVASTRAKLKAKAMETHKDSDWQAYFNHLNQEGRLIQRPSA